MERTNDDRAQGSRHFSTPTLGMFLFFLSFFIPLLIICDTDWLRQRQRKTNTMTAQWPAEPQTPSPRRIPFVDPVASIYK